MGNSGSKDYGSDPSYKLPKQKYAPQPLNVIILGGHEVEKSTVGNAILGRKAFYFWSFFFNRCVEKQGNVNGRFIKVVHAPGWTGFNHTTSEYNKKEIMTSVFRCSEGLVACVLVVSIDSESPEKDRKAAEQHMELIGGSVWEHTVLVFIRHKPDESNQKETDIMNKHKWLREKCGNRCHWLDKDHVNDLIEKLVGAATWYNVYDSCFKANNSAFSQESQMDSQCPEERTETENVRLQQENIEPQQQATTSIWRGTTQESHHELSSASENTSGQLRKVFNIHVPSGPDSQQGALFVDEYRAELIKMVTIPIPIADSLLAENMIDQQLYDEIQKAGTNPERMRLIYTALNAEAKKVAFLKQLIQMDRYLVQDLAKKKLEELEASNTAAD